VEKNCNRLDVRETPTARGLIMEVTCSRVATQSGRGLNMKTRGACYGKPVAQKTVWMLNTFVRKSPREIRDMLYLGLLSL
jgi:hypothetical protein